MKNIRTRQELKTYFERGDRPTEQEFSELIDGYVHLNELNFGFSVRPTSETYYEYYDFYISEKLPNVGMGHIINKGQEGKDPEYFEDYKHVLGRPVGFKN